VSALVRKRDGRLEPYHEAKVKATILKGFAKDAKVPDNVSLAQELARSLSFFLFKGREQESSWRSRPGSIVTFDELSDAVLRALRETGYPDAAAQIFRHSQWRSDRREKVRLPNDRALTVLSRKGESPWTKSRILTKLTRVAGLSTELATDIARTVEQRIFAAGLQRVTATLLQEVIDAELEQRGLSAKLGPRKDLGWTAKDIELALDAGRGQNPQTLRDDIASESLRRYALEHVFKGTVGLALEHGAIALYGADSPLSLLAVDISKEASHSLGALLRQVHLLERHCRSWLIWSPNKKLIHEVSDLSHCLSLWEQRTPKLVTRLNGIWPQWIQGAPWSGQLHLDLPPNEREAAETEGLFEYLKASIELGGRVTVSLSDTGTAAYPWSERPEVDAFGEIGFVNLVRVALRAGRGERARFSEIMEVSIDLALKALLAKQELIKGKVFRPNLPLWQPLKSKQEANDQPMNTRNVVHGLVPVGLTGALRYLTGQGPNENPRVEKLAEEVFREFRRQTRSLAKRNGVKVDILDFAEACEELSRHFSAADTMGFPDAEELGSIVECYEVGLSGPGSEGHKKKLSRSLSMCQSITERELAEMTQTEWREWIKRR
jgi:hypothetical protein